MEMPAAPYGRGPAVLPWRRETGRLQPGMGLYIIRKTGNVMGRDEQENSRTGRMRMQDMVTGLVKQNLNEEHRNMVLVEYRLAEGGNIETDWMPVMMPCGGPGYGKYLMPETGTEVVIGFRFGDRSKPFVMGALLENMDSVPEAGGTGNIPARMLKTRTGFTVSVDEEQDGFLFTDPAGQNQVAVSSGKDHGSLVIDIREKVEIRLGGEAYLTLEKEEVTFAGNITVCGEDIHLKAEKDLSACSGTMTLDSGRKLILKGQDIDVLPVQGFKLGGMKADIISSQNINVKTTQLKVEGTTAQLSALASLQMKADGIVEVKGSMVKLN